MRLIDADAMLNEVSLESIFIPCGKESTELALRQWINKQPTAYDVSKVIEELEEKQYQANKDMQISELYEDVQAYGGKYLAFGEAIEIVKAGGVDE
jgi:hypothetical protein